jgi:hypothetical protein
LELFIFINVLLVVGFSISAIIDVETPNGDFNP